MTTKHWSEWKVGLRTLGLFIIAFYFAGGLIGAYLAPFTTVEAWAMGIIAVGAGTTALFIRDNNLGDDAVSPVIAVILMVAITVVLAATVFALVTDLAEPPERTEMAAFTKEGNSTLVVTYARPGLTWGELAVSGCDFYPTDGMVNAGERIENCNGNVTVVHKPSNTLVYRTEF